MWGVDDEIRAAIMACRRQVMDRDPGVVSALTDLYKKISEMFFKRGKHPGAMLAELLTEDEWLAIARKAPKSAIAWSNQTVPGFRSVMNSKPMPTCST
jgi:DUF438 domain-containing protein